MRVVLLAILFCCGVTTEVWGQGAAPRDPRTGAAKGTAEIRGRVTDAAGKPLRRARISLELRSGEHVSGVEVTLPEGNRATANLRLIVPKQ